MFKIFRTCEQNTMNHKKKDGLSLATLKGDKGDLHEALKLQPWRLTEACSFTVYSTFSLNGYNMEA